MTINTSTLTKEQILTAFNSRHATKKFDKNKKISNDDFNFLLEVARFSPSSYGFEPWDIIVLNDRVLRKTLCEITPNNASQIETSSHLLIFRVKTASNLKPGADYLHHIMKDVHNMSDELIKDYDVSFKEFCEEKYVMSSNREITDWAGKQAYIAMGNVMSTAAMIGIDSCPIEGFSYRETENALEEKGVIDLQQDRICVMLALGYRAKEPKLLKTRRPINEIVKIFPTTVA